MKAVRFNGSNAVTNWSSEQNGPCEPIPVRSDNGVYTSVWRPTKEELAVLAWGGCLVLQLASPEHPPVRISTVDYPWRPIPSKI